MENFSKTILIILFIYYLLNISSVFALESGTTAEGDYPLSTEYPAGASKFDFKYPWEGTKTLGGSEGLVFKFYTYALAAVGVTALGAIIYGGILYTVSAGNASKQTEAKEWITGAIWGIVLLLGAALLLNTINPELLKLTDPSKFIK